MDLTSNKKEFNLKEFIFKYISYLPFILISMAIFFTIAFIKIRYETPIYSVQGSLLINKDAKNGGNRSESIEDMFLFSDNVNLKNELEILKSPSLIRRVVKNLLLQIRYHNKGNVRSSNIYGFSPLELEILMLKDSSKSFEMEIEVFEDKFKFQKVPGFLEYDKAFENSTGIFKLKRIPGVSFNEFRSNVFIITYSPLEKATENLASSISTTQFIDQATILNISIETDNITFGKAVINELMKEYGLMNVEDKRQISRMTMEFIDDRLDAIKNELGDVEGGLLRFREKNNVIDLTEQSKLYYNSLSESNKELVEQQVQVGVVNYLLKYISDPDNEFKIVPTDLGIQEATLLPILSQYNTLQLQRNNLIQSTGPSNNTLITLNSMLKKLREQIHEALNNVKNSYNISISSLENQIQKSQSSLKMVPSKAKGLLDIERQQKIKQDLYLFLLQKREEAAISAAATLGNSSPIEEASSTEVPVRPNKRSIYFIALFAGILIPAGVIALIEMLNDKLVEKDEIIKRTQIPIVGEIGHAVDQTLVVQPSSRKVIAEQFRIMRTSTQYLIGKKNNPVILVTSSVSGEGKSFIATNYGAVIALTGRKTIILEFDIRKPRLLKGLNITSNKGLTNFIIGNATLDEIIIPVPEYPNLFVIGCGPIPPNPSELLLDFQVTNLFKQLKESFDFIIIDTAPVGLVSDAFTLSSFADVSLYIVRQGYTVKKQIDTINELYQKMVLPNLGLIINDIKSTGKYKGYYGYSSGYYGGYGYGYGNGSEDYFQKETKKSRFSFFKLW